MTCAGCFAPLLRSGCVNLRPGWDVMVAESGISFVELKPRLRHDLWHSHNQCRSSLTYRPRVPMKKLLVALIASVFATIAFSQDKMKDEKKKVEATKPYGNTPTENKASAVPAKDAAPAKTDSMKSDSMKPAKKDAAPMASDGKDKKAAKAEKSKMRADKQKEEIKADVKKPDR